MRRGERVCCHYEKRGEGVLFLNAPQLLLVASQLLLTFIVGSELTLVEEFVDGLSLSKLSEHHRLTQSGVKQLASGGQAILPEPIIAQITQQTLEVSLI